MIILGFGILLIIISLIGQKKLPPYWGLIIVFIIMGFQEGVPGDFMSYKATYQNSFMEIRTAEFEPLWAFIFNFSSLFIPFWAFVALMSAFQCWILWKMGKRYGSKEYGFLGPILFFFTFNMMLLQMKALREGLAVEMCVLAYYMVTEKRGVLWALLITIGAYFTHNAAVVFIPFLILQIIMSRRKKMNDDRIDIITKHSLVLPITMTILYFVVFTLKETGLMIWLNQAAMLAGDEIRLADYLIIDQKYIDDNKVSRLLIFYDAIMVFLSTWFLQRASIRYKVLAVASIVACFGEMILVGIGSLPRVMMFYLIFNIFTYPKIVETVSRKFSKPLAYLLMVFLIGYAMKTSTFWMTIAADDRFGTYRFVFFDLL